MTAAAAPELKARSIRVALTATLYVALTYLVISLAVVTFVTSDLTGNIDHRLLDSLHNVPREPRPEGEPFQGPPGDRPFGPTLLVWTIHPDGTVSTDDQTAPSLPAELQRVTDPESATLEGTELRLAGAQVGPDYVVIGQTLDEVSRARSTIVLAEVLIAPLLLGVVFLGAVVIGRRVAAPIELARRRQLEFTADASHELRTPLSVIEAHTSLALTQDRSAVWYRTAFERVDHESKRMHELLDNLLWLAQFDTTRAAPNAEPVDLGILASQAADRFGAIAETRHLNLAVQVADEGTVVTAPPEWLDRLLGVLLDNACKYAPEGGMVDLTVNRASGRVHLVVDDSGPGIPEDQRERIFDRFHRATEGPGGAGLGLAIGQAIVQATGGRWEVGRSPAGGARMAVSWRGSSGG
jgi:two-component system sensor histidine kinase CiaH